MSQVYHPKKTSTKLLEGFVAGLIGGLVVAVIMAVLDFFIAGPSVGADAHPWWRTPSEIGSFFVGSPEANAQQLNLSAWLVGTLIHFVLFGILGMGLMQYKPIFRRFKIDIILGGAIYGLIIYLTVFLYALSFYKPGAGANLNQIPLAIAVVLGGAAMGLWLKRETQPATA